MAEDRGRRFPVKFAVLLFFEKFNGASRGRKLEYGKVGRAEGKKAENGIEEIGKSPG